MRGRAAGEEAVSRMHAAEREGDGWAAKAVEAAESRGGGALSTEAQPGVLSALHARCSRRIFCVVGGPH